MPSTPSTKQTRSHGRSDEFPRLLAGRLCLDFVNTVEDPFDTALDFLHDYSDLARWVWHARAIDDGELRRLKAAAKKSPQLAERVFAEAVGLRQMLEHVFRAIAGGEEPTAADIEHLQQQHLEGLSAASVVREGRQYRWSWRGVNDLRIPLWRVIESAVELLTEGDLSRVRACPGADDCGWLFYDTSRNGTRRWCSMEGCGSRVKMRRHYARQKQYS